MPDPALTVPAAFRCAVCGGTEVARATERGDGVRVLFCAGCDMGVVEHRPATTAQFYTDDYYHRVEGGAHGYDDYEFTAEHALLWVKLLIEALAPGGGAILDIGCATGFLLRRLEGVWRRHGIETNQAAAAIAADSGVEIIGTDVLAPGFAAAHAGAFDIITSIATFEHVLDIKQAVAASMAMLAPTGVLILELPLISETRDNSNWYNGSYEHIFYPTVRGIEALFAGLPGVRFQGFETATAGFSSTYIGAATRDPARFATLAGLFAAMTAEDPTALSDDAARLNLAYAVVHDFRPTPARILRLPVLLERHFTPNLGRRLAQLWHEDAVRAAASDWNAAQARSVEAALEAALEALKAGLPDRPTRKPHPLRRFFAWTGR